MDKNKIPAVLLSIVAEELSTRQTHAELDNSFLYADAPGEPPEGSKHVKALAWLQRINKESSNPLKVCGTLIETYMEEEPPESDRLQPPQEFTSTQIKINKALKRSGLNYFQGGKIAAALASSTVELEILIKQKDIPALDEEFRRALATVESSPREAVSAASNLLESLCKVYIDENQLEKPVKQDLKPVWTIVRKHLGFDPSLVEDQDLQVILGGLISCVEGIGALRTHASSAHGAGKNGYVLEPRHAKLAINSAHTVALFILESWTKKKMAKTAKL